MPLNHRQIQTIGECLRAAAYGPFFPDGEFDTIFGLSRSRVASVADQWPVVIDAKDIADLAIQSSLNNLTGYPIKPENRKYWDEYISVDPAEVRTAFKSWLANK